MGTQKLTVSLRPFFSRLLAPINWYSAFRQSPISLKDQIMKKYQHYIDVRGEFYQLHAAQQQLLRPLNNLKKRNLQK